MKKQKSTYATDEIISKEWVIVDAKDQVLGRLASQVAMILRGKNKPTYTPSMDTGDFVVVINSDKIRLTGNKANQKVYYRHSNYPGGLKETSFKAQMEKDSTKIIEDAVRGMLPKTKMGRKLFKHMKVYAGESHPHEAQAPKPVQLI